MMLFEKRWLKYAQNTEVFSKPELTKYFCTDAQIFESHNKSLQRITVV